MIINTIATELGAKNAQVEAAVKLLDEGATVPFIARYRKEVTQGLDDNQLRILSQRLTYLRELNDRRQVIIKSVKEQDKLSAELEQKLLAADNKTELEDLYLPYKPRRRTKGQIAIEAGLLPLAEQLLEDLNANPDALAASFVHKDKAIDDTKAALDGAKFILMERFAENASVLQAVRKHLLGQAHVVCEVIKGMEKQGEKFTDYFAYSEKFSSIPSHRALAVFRGRNEGILQVSIDPEPANAEAKGEVCERLIKQALGLQLATSARDAWLHTVVQWTWRVKIKQHLETELFAKLREQAETEAIDVFAKNLKDLLMAAPAGPKVTLGLDPGLRTGVKVAVLDETGKVLATTTIFPHVPQNAWDKSLRTLANLCKQHKVQLISIGNGTGSRETDKLVAEMMKANSDLGLQKLIVSEAGASVYSASELASNELPNMDVSLRGAVSIGRRLQDPLAELVKIEAKAIGVGQYQHDVNQSQLALSLDNVIEDCVNAVGVDLNTASPALLSYVSGLNKTLANNIVQYRDAEGAFSNRKALKKVERLGPKAFEQAAGFLRIMNGDNPIDRSAVHPEAYEVVETIVQKVGVAVNDVIGNKAHLQQVKPQDLVSDKFGLPTVTDILKELEKPGRDPRPEFKTAKFNESVSSMDDLKPGLVLEGVVSNVANFGAFVDIGVHQDGLVHISALTNKFIKDPREVVKTGDVVKVKVMEVDVKRKRISLTMRLDEDAATVPAKNRSTSQKTPHQKPKHARQQNNTHAAKIKPDNSNAAMGNAFAAAFAKAKK
ncbi:Tex family protein [Glaciecola petra]|uniref:Tex family protein n=1 Tax=Glaciecola petra TaxID=3075602 RepID=A0ABU2ZR93_9ALTE|nr:Tex family protein [Aestuariibacter sp. P117]MDT0595154.1 Tex family protein [Aestuariibacter sp. P117]